MNKIDLLERDAVKQKFNEAMNTHNPNMVTFYDHGSNDAFIGNDGQPVVDTWNVDKLKNKEVYSLCCSAGKGLGPEAYRKGCKAFWSYNKPFSFTTTEEEIFCKLANMGLIIRNETGCSWEIAVEQVQEAYDIEIDRLRAENANPFLIIALVNDMTALVCYTDMNPPSSDCIFRNMSIRLFGLAGQKITRMMGVATVLGYICFGVALHDFCHTLYEVGGYQEILSPQGGYIGFLGMLVANYILIKEYLRSLK